MAAFELLAFGLSPDLHELLSTEQGRAYQVLWIIVQLAVVLLAARIFGTISERIRVPRVVGELVAGAIVGPYLLGSKILLPMHGQWISLFPSPAAGQWPVSDPLWAIAQIGSIVLLFSSGLRTDLREFLRYIAPATLVAVAGVAVPFGLGVAAVYLFRGVLPIASAPVPLVAALFLGTILAATSIGITARVLADIERLDTPEGVTILGAAVVDDVLGIIALAIVGGIASATAAQGASHSIDVGQSVIIACKAFGVWIALTIAAMLLARPTDRLVASVGGGAVSIVLIIAFIGSAVAELFGLAFIIGAYSVGLGLSRTRSAGRLLEQIQPIEHFLVPVFFATLGMLANFGAIFADWRIVVAGLAITLIAVLGKVLGCGLAALPGGFNLRGAWRIGVGMTPRGEVALIVAGIGLSRSLIDQNLYGISILMTLLTTIIAPVLLVRAFASGASGRRRPERRAVGLPSMSQLPGLSIQVPADLGQVLLDRLVQIAESAGWEVAYERDARNTRLLRSRGDAAQVQLQENTLKIDASDTRQQEFATFAEQARRSIATAMER